MSVPVVPSQLEESTANEWVGRVSEYVRSRSREWVGAWRSAEPFYYVVMDDFFPPDLAEMVHEAYPGPEAPIWENTTYIHQRRKLTLSSNFPEAIQSAFDVMASHEFRRLMTEITGIEGLVDDPDLAGGGLHQILRGGFLDVHVDYNNHPKTKLHRRLNLLLYMNKNWKDEYEGYLELWDMSAKRRLERLAPSFNRAIMFETNEISFHGHPRPLKGPQDVTRKSLAVYYYTHEREKDKVALEHNTIYRNTTGASGYWKTLRASIAATTERMKSYGVLSIADNLVRRTKRKLQRLPPENR